jgi:beta-1,4-mannooligosaccharide/beta-1,4-mannosyl-N-acetylglucosamine phosphorylase
MSGQKFKKDATKLLTRYPKPVMHVDDFPGIAQLYNPAVVKYNDEFIMLVSVVDYAADGEGTDVGETRIARSKDGINFTLSDENFIKMPDVEPFNLAKHFIDNRITKIDDTYYIVTPVMMKGGWLAPVGMLGKTKDFTSYEPISIITAPRNRGCSIFPEKIIGMYYKLDRPYD